MRRTQPLNPKRPQHGRGARKSLAPEDALLFRTFRANYNETTLALLLGTSPTTLSKLEFGGKLSVEIVDRITTLLRRLAAEARAGAK